MDKWQKRSLAFWLGSIFLIAIVAWFASYAFTIGTLQADYNKDIRVVFIEDYLGNINHFRVRPDEPTNTPFIEIK